MTSLRDHRPLAAVFTLTVYGTPAPAGSKRALPLGGKFGGRAIVVDANVRSKPWKNLIAQNAGLEMNGRELFRRPLHVNLTFHVRRPKAHFNSKGELKKSAPMWPAKKPDVLKLARGVEDALSGIVYADDAQIVTEFLVKRYGEQECVEIEIAQASR